jgi:hypothetical protein
MNLRMTLWKMTIVILKTITITMNLKTLINLHLKTLIFCTRRL